MLLAELQQKMEKDRFGSSAAWSEKEESDKWVARREQERAKAAESDECARMAYVSTQVLQAELREMRQRFSALTAEEPVPQETTWVDVEPKKRRKKKKKKKKTTKPVNREDGLHRAAALAGLADAAALLREDDDDEPCGRSVVKKKKKRCLPAPEQQQRRRRPEKEDRRLPKIVDDHTHTASASTWRSTAQMRVPPHLRRAQRLLGREGKHVEDLQFLTDLIDPPKDKPEPQENTEDQFARMMAKFFPGMDFADAVAGSGSSVPARRGSSVSGAAAGVNQAPAVAAASANQADGASALDRVSKQIVSLHQKGHLALEDANQVGRMLTGDAQLIKDVKPTQPLRITDRAHPLHMSQVLRSKDENCLVNRSKLPLIACGGGAFQPHSLLHKNSS